MYMCKKLQLVILFIIITYIGKLKGEAYNFNDCTNASNVNFNHNKLYIT